MASERKVEVWTAIGLDGRPAPELGMGVTLGHAIGVYGLQSRCGWMTTEADITGFRRATLTVHEDQETLE